MKELIWKFLFNNVGEERFQRIYLGGLKLALAAMNYGRGGSYRESGELHVLEIVKQRFNDLRNFVIFDVGANIGGYAREAARILGPRAIIHAFEPSRKCFATFTEHTRGLPLVANNFGFSDRTCDDVLYSDHSDSDLASLYHRRLDHYGISMANTENIHLTTIDEYCQEKKIDRIHFLKLDVEGHELNALKGAEHMLNEDRIDMIQFEFGGCNIDSRTFFQDFFYLLNDRYRIHRILRNGLMELPAYNEMQEIFITVNYLAINRSN